MGYVNTPAHMSASLARHGGDRIWAGKRKLVVRRANVYSTRSANLPTALPGTNLGYVESIGPILQAVIGAGTATYGIIQARKDKKSADSAAQKAQQIEAQAVEAAKLQAQAQIQQAQQMQVQQQSAPSNNLPAILSIAAAGMGLLLYVLKR